MMTTDNYNYDVAISFAEEDRNAALALALALELIYQKSVYYYPENLEVTLGKPIGPALEATYAKEARFAVILLSDVYFQKYYTQVELAAILKRMAERPGEVYTIPVMLTPVDLSREPALERLGRLDWNYDPKKVAEIMASMFGKKINPWNRDAQQAELTLLKQSNKSENGLKLTNSSITGGISIVTNNSNVYGKR